MTTADVIEYGLKAKGYGGLYNPGLECGCCLDDLAPCGNPDFEECIAGYKTKTEPGSEFEGEWLIMPRKTHFRPPILPQALGLAVWGAVIVFVLWRWLH